MSIIIGEGGASGVILSPLLKVPGSFDMARTSSKVATPQTLPSE